MGQQPAFRQAQRLLKTAALQLNTPDPGREPYLNGALQESLSLPAGAQEYRRQPGVFDTNFAETAGDNLSFVMSPAGPWASPDDRLARSTEVMRELVGRHFGPGALYWFDGRSEPMRGQGHRSVSWGARLGAGFDRGGLMESLVTYEWGPQVMDALPPHLYNIARVAIESLPGLRPAFSTVRCGRSAGSQQLTFEMDYPLALTALKPLMDNLGLGSQHPSLMSTCAFLLGARFMLPPGTTTLTLRPARDGVELRLDVNLDALADTPPQLVSLLRLQLAERPKSLRALDRWLAAMTPEDYHSPGSVSVLSIRVQPDVPARVALYLRPSAILAPPDEEAAPVPAAENPASGRNGGPQTSPAAPAAGSAAWR